MTKATPRLVRAPLQPSLPVPPPGRAIFPHMEAPDRRYEDSAGFIRETWEERDKDDARRNMEDYRKHVLRRDLLKALAPPASKDTPRRIDGPIHVSLFAFVLKKLGL